jgi:hypothetical protein
VVGTKDRTSEDWIATEKIYASNLEDEIIEIQEFCEIADKIPHLGQYFVDFSFFLNNKMITEDDYEYIMKVFNTKMRKNNI